MTCSSVTTSSGPDGAGAAGDAAAGGGTRAGDGVGSGMGRGGVGVAWRKGSAVAVRVAVDVTVGGSEALERAQQEPLVDLLVVDLGLPDMDGLELAARLRVLIPSLPVLVITGSVVPDELPRFVVGVVAKPYRSKDLTAAVRAALDARQTEVREVAG